MSNKSVRVQVLEGLIAVSIKGRSAQDIVPGFSELPDADRRLAFELFYGSLQHYFELQAAIKNRLKKPLKQTDDDLRLILVLGLYQLAYTRIADHAALNETVDLCHHIKKSWATKLVNAILRRYQRDQQSNQQEKLSKADAVNLPSWLVQQIAQDWPDLAAEIYAKSHERAPLTIRINTQKTTVDSYQKALEEQDISFSTHPHHQTALHIERSGDITKLPGYAEGWFSVQDGAAQFAATILDAKPGDRILDACAAPGGKTSHILERCKGPLDLIALDNVESRLVRLNENLQRLDVNADVRLGDALTPSDWLKPDEGLFDRILLDAPCSATGIIRRHPDIALHRRLKDIRALSQLQWRLLKVMWEQLKPGGTLIYSTCSILKAENENMVADFLKQNADAQLVPFKVDSESQPKPGLWQIFPGQDNMDGFFYSKIAKQD